MIDKSESEIMKNWKLNNHDEIVVSIRCLAYNHEKYISQCLDGFLMQETSFPFKIVIHDDASTDATAQIIREYEHAYPALIDAIYETENMYSKGDGSLGRIINPHCTGKYLALCEGDDYWTDPQKLQLQFDALEAHPECSLCTCLVARCEENGKPIDDTIPNRNLDLYGINGVIERKYFIKLISGDYPFHTSSYFMRIEAYYLSIPDVTNCFKRDRGILFRNALKSTVYYINRPMSVRRIGAPYSWTKNQQKLGKAGWSKTQIENYCMILSFDKYTFGEFRDILFPAAMKWLNLTIGFDTKAASKHKNEYKGLLGKKEFRRRYLLFIKSLQTTGKIKYLLFEYAPFLCDLLIAGKNLIRKEE